MNYWRNLLFLTSLFMTVGCQVTRQPEPEFKVSPNINLVPVEVRVTAPAMPKLSSSQVGTELGSLLERQLVNAKNAVIEDGNQQLPAELRNKQICKDGVEVSYQLPDANGYKNNYLAEIQLQGRLMGLSPDKESVKVKLWGWYSENNNLQKWRMYLKQQPKARNFSLVSGEEIWSEAQGWYWCRFDDDKILKI